MKIYALRVNGEIEWIAANTVIEALQNYITITGIELTDFELDDDIKEVPKEKWSQLKVMCYDRQSQSEQTFAEVIRHMKSPDIIAIPC